MKMFIFLTLDWLWLNCKKGKYTVCVCMMCVYMYTKILIMMYFKVYLKWFNRMSNKYKRTVVSLLIILDENPKK